MHARPASLGSLLLLLLMTSLHAQPQWPGDVPGAPAAPPGRQLGVLVEDLPLERLDALELPYGVRITRVFPGSPAQAGGLRADDIILEAGGQPVFSVARLRWLIDKSAPRNNLDLAYYRDGARASAAVRLGSPAPGLPPAYLGRSEPGWTSASYLGVGLQPLTPGLREAFSVPPGIGVLITEVFPETPASRAGLSAGDVIVRMDRRAIGQIGDVHRVLDYFDPGEQLVVEVIREQTKQELTVTLGQRDSSPGPERPEAETQPLFDPAWWGEVERFMDRWKDYFERRLAAPPPEAL